MRVKVLESVFSKERKEYIKCTIELGAHFSVTGDIGVSKRGKKKDPVVILGKELRHVSCGRPQKRDS